MEISKTALWHEHYKACQNYKFVISQGGSSSGKTYNILDMLLYRMCTEKNLVITVTAPNFPHLRRGCIRDVNNIVFNDELYKKMIGEVNQFGCKCSMTNSIMEFATFPSVEVSKGSKRDILYVDECTGLPYEIFWELAIRSKQNVIVSYNPTARFYIHDQFEGRSDARFIYSTHKANKFIPQSIHDELDSLEFKDPWRWHVYCLGECGRTDGLIYENWTQCETLPDVYQWRVFGLDFGFVNSYTTLIEVRYVNGELYVKEHIYQRNLTNQEIAKKISDLGFKGEFIICDSAELKSIEELKRAGIINAKAANKGPGSVIAGIDLLKSMKINIHIDSEHIKTDMLNYKWKEDDLGHFSNTPDKDHYDPHTLDALRYAVYYKFVKPKTNTYIGGY